MLDSSVYLTSFGWKGKGNGLRQNSASRPLAIPQKRTLAGVGKDRDEAFPFWDHVFAAAAKSIQIKVSGDDAGNENDPLPQTTLLRTTTGILSNRRPVTGTPATSGTATPSDSGAQNPMPRLNLLAIAKRESARKRLYAGFFRGPILGPDEENDTLKTTEVAEQIVGEVETTRMRSDDQVEQPKKKSKEKKKRKRDDVELPMHKAKKSKKMMVERQHADHDTITDADSRPRNDDKDEQQKPEAKRKDNESAEEKRNRRLAKAERKKLKEDRRRRKEERRKDREERSKSGTTVSRKD